MLKVTSLSTIVSTNPQFNEDEEEEEERIFPSTVPHIQNHMVTKPKFIEYSSSGPPIFHFLAIPLVKSLYHYIL